MSRNPLDRVHGADDAGTDPRGLEGRRSEDGMVVEILARRPAGDGVVGMEESSRAGPLVPVRVACRAAVVDRPRRPHRGSSAPHRVRERGTDPGSTVADRSRARADRFPRWLSPSGRPRPRVLHRERHPRGASRRVCGPRSWSPAHPADARSRPRSRASSSPARTPLREIDPLIRRIGRTGRRCPRPIARGISSFRWARRAASSTPTLRPRLLDCGHGTSPRRAPRVR
jgi:hypothetical protein